jgi:aminoglycoside 6'-N-acetyltransferase I
MHAEVAGQRLQPCRGGLAVNATIRLLGPSDVAVLDHVAEEVFDNPVHPRWSAEFLADPRHHLAVALDRDLVVGFASAVHYVHPDKPPEMWVNEVGVAPAYRNRGIGRALVKALFQRGKELGCEEAWLGTEVDNAAARRMYLAVGGEEEPMVVYTFRLNG